MTYRSLQRANAYFYDPERRLAVIKRHGGVSYLSSGVNHLKAPSVLLELAGRELRERRLIENYTSPGGALGVGAAISFEMHDRLGRGAHAAITPANICLTVGATGALAGAFRYLADVAGATTALVLGLNYSFFSTVCDEVGIRYAIACSELPDRLLPSAEEACARIAAQRPSVVVLSQPTNPSGEYYDASELRRVVAAAEAAGCWLVFDEVPSLACPRDDDLPVPLPDGPLAEFPRRLIWISSYSKSRSLAGLRVGYLLAAPELVGFVRSYNERSLWSPVNAGSTALIADMILRVIARRLRQAGDADSRPIIARAVRGAGHYMQLFAPFSDDFSRFDGIWRFIDDNLDWAAAIASYQSDLGAVSDVCRSNWQDFVARIGPHLTQAIALQSGFNHCVRLHTGLTEWDFVAAAFDQAGTDFYTETVFADHDDASCDRFWVRVSCAVDPAIFARGTEQLAAFLDTASPGR
ncbi:MULTISPECIES: pyridoxal phosphate-dependent aminotransferase [Rhodopseudomonas]|uniref:pyridoxal phosphate-dependent aminotransferase n=1 Tax=Rhodopseudomonas TaxID=1073 RepID=UPI000A7DAC90|nr:MULTISPECIES: pyridoxal phosphate-dependent aminotransferase [Rhodopseudomonas]MDF3808910.1 pyridoxal phosphate-dependent aminotransferase [Rhodopseudomonas sp. BAL398]WOK18381.1 pyridoxal phosphate-dependent aminotransferase [Rhodopseudomonas sp. BAL398]